MNKEFWENRLKANEANYEGRLKAIEQILRNERGYIIDVPFNEYAILLHSGGLDSTCMIDIVIREWNCKIIPLYFRRDSRNQKWEEKAVDFFYEFYKDKYPENIVELVKIESQIPSRINKEYMDLDRKLVMGLPMRNSTMMNMAVTQAVYLSSKYNETIRTVLTGSVGDDLQNPESGLLSIRSQTLHTCICLAEWHWQIIAPLTDTELKGRPFFKVGLIQYAKVHNIPIKQTRSCFGKTEEPCGECLACKARQKAFEVANSTS